MNLFYIKASRNYQLIHEINSLCVVTLISKLVW